MRRPIHSAILVLAVTALGATGCEEAKATTTTPPDPVYVTETFTGTLNANGSSSFSFFASQSGNVTATLTTVEPDTTIAIGLSLGTWNGTVCQVVLPNDNAVQGTIINGVVSQSSFLCVRVNDVGKVIDPLTYTITVVHP